MLKFLAGVQLELFHPKILFVTPTGNCCLWYDLRMAEQGQVAPNPQDLDEAIEVPKRNQTPAQPPVTFREFDVKYSTILSKNSISTKLYFYTYLNFCAIMERNSWIFHLEKVLKIEFLCQKSRFLTKNLADSKSQFWSIFDSK